MFLDNINLSQATGINANANTVTSVELYPNPAPDNNFMININASTPEEEVEVSIYDISGHLVFAHNYTVDHHHIVNGNEIPHQLAAGVYIVNGRVGEKTEQKKLVIQ